MLKISPTYFRLIIVLALILFAISFLIALLGIVSFSKEVETARGWNYFDSLVSFGFVQAYWVVSALALLISCAGMLVFWPPSRWILLFTIILSLLAQPFLGLLVLSPFEATVGSISAVLLVWALTISFWSPLAKRFTRSAT